MKYTPQVSQDNVNVSPISPAREFMVLMSGVVGLLALTYIGLGVAVDWIVPRIPAKFERRLEIVFAKTYTNEIKTAAQQRLQAMLDALAIGFPDQAGPFIVHLVDSSKVNAMALPGGHIVVFSGFVNVVRSENELAFVLVHELGHFAHRDHLRGLGRGLVFLVVSVAFFGEDSALTRFLSNSLTGLDMRFSQAQERAADLLALELLNKRYGHVGGATAFFERLAKRNVGGRLIYFFETHPAPPDRIHAIAEEIQRKGYLVKEPGPLDAVLKEAAAVSNQRD